MLGNRFFAKRFPHPPQNNPIPLAITKTGRETLSQGISRGAEKATGNPLFM